MRSSQAFFQQIGGDCVPSTFSTFHIGWRGLFASRMGMDVTAHNIANVNTEGYSRQHVKLTASRPWAMPGLNRPTSPGQLGTGVDVDGSLDCRRSPRRFAVQNGPVERCGSPVSNAV